MGQIDRSTTDCWKSNGSRSGARAGGRSPWRRRLVRTVLAWMLARGIAVFGRRPWPRGRDGDDRSTVHVRDEHRGRHPAGLQVGRRSATRWRRTSVDRGPLHLGAELRRLFGLHPCNARPATPGRRDHRGDLAGPGNSCHPLGARSRAEAARFDLLLVLRLVPPGAADLPHRCPRLLEAAQ